MKVESMAYFKHKSPVVEAHQFNPSKKDQKLPPYLDAFEVGKKAIIGTIKGPNDEVIHVYPTDWVVYGRKSSRFVIKNGAFKEFFEQVGKDQ